MRLREELWNAVELGEQRKDAQLARDFTVALPTELSFEERLQLIQRFVDEEMIALGMIVDLAVHRPDRQSDRRNWHAHLLVTMRELNQGGFGKKVREWNQKSLLENWREKWATYTNQALSDAGFGSRVDHRTLERQKNAALIEGDLDTAILFDREPTCHLGAHATAMERKYIQTDRGDINREITERNTIRAKILNDVRALYNTAMSAIRSATSQLNQAWTRIEAALANRTRNEDTEKDRTDLTLATTVDNPQVAPKRKRETGLDRARSRLRALVENKSANSNFRDGTPTTYLPADEVASQCPEANTPSPKSPKN
jgi:ATP-dependent exoDNAse (exonuclease V) alpha subunit